MASKSTSAHARRKSKARPIQLTQTMIREQAWKEYRAFIDNISDAEMRVIGHVKPYDFGPDPKRLMNEFRRLLGLSIAKCKVIPFPVRNHQSKSAMEA